MKKETYEKANEKSLKTLRQEIERLIYSQRMESLKIYREAHEQYEKGKISEELFKKFETEYERQEDRLDAFIYQLSHGPKRSFFKLIEIRKEKNLTQADVAEKAGISLSWYQLLEQGHKKGISPKAKQKVCDALGVSYEKLFIPAIAWWGKKTPEEIDKLWEEEERKRKE